MSMSRQHQNNFNSIKCVPGNNKLQSLVQGCLKGISMVKKLNVEVDNLKKENEALLSKLEQVDADKLDLVNIKVERDDTEEESGSENDCQSGFQSPVAKRQKPGSPIQPPDQYGYHAQKHYLIQNSQLQRRQSK